MGSVIELNGNRYHVDSILQSYVNRLSTPFRTTGVQVRSDDSSINRYIHSAYPKGIGWQEMHRDSGRGVGGLLDSTCWTVDSVVALAKLHETQTHADPAEHLIKAVLFKGDLWGLFEEDYATDELTEVASRKFGATSDDWTGGSTVSVSNNNALGSRGFDIVVHKGKLYVLNNGAGGTSWTSTAEDVYGIRSSSDGITWANVTGTGFPDSTTTNQYLTTTITRRNNVTLFDDMGKLLSFGNTLLAAIYRHPDGVNGDSLVEVISTTDEGTNWASDVTIPSGDGPKAFVDWYDLAGARSPVLITAEGVYSIDTANNTFDLIYELDGDPNNGRWAAVGNDGALYVGLGSGELLRIAITDIGHLDVITVGPPGDGFVTARQGHVNWILKTPSKWLLVAYGGHAANKNASIFMIDISVLLTDPETGNKFMPWFHMYQHGTANVDIVTLAYSTEDDATPRFHMALEGSTADTLQHIEEPITNIKTSTTIKYQTDGIIRIPADDLGDPQTTAMVLTGLVDADDLTAGSGGSGGSGDEFILQD
ncbi:MAG: hypothetical protein J3T61_00805, partial [Candidatus Brocadiales bacterium]|nr:hypothetical protein [Candidatus Bathyanammoxibius sp.]